LFSGCFNNQNSINIKHIDPPKWYCNILSKDQNTYIGYGSATTQLEARQNALNDIASQILTTVKYSMSIKKDIIDDSYSKVLNNRSIHTADANISDYKIIKMVHKDSQYFIAIEYENIPNIDKFKHKLKQNNIDVNFENYLKTFELFRKDKRWYIKYQDIVQMLDQKEFFKFFDTISNPHITLSTNHKNNILYEYDSFYLNIKSKYDGYMSVLFVDEFGTVSILRKNIPCGVNSLLKLPNPRYEDMIEVGLAHPNKETFDMAVAIYSDKRLNLDRFVIADYSFVYDEKYKNFDELVNFLKDREFSTLKIVTKPNAQRP
jgi:hypothetical protein